MSKKQVVESSICWNCKNCTGGCSWSSSFIPVKGWQAIKTNLKINDNSFVKSYLVIKCPLFIDDNKKEITLDYICDCISKKLNMKVGTVRNNLKQNSVKFVEKLNKTNNTHFLTMYKNYLIDKSI